MRCLRSKYELDHRLGLDYYITTTTGLGGTLRENTDDFIVDEIPIEILPNQTGEYTQFTMEKRNWESVGAIRAIARATRVPQRRFSYAGNKDKRALTTQRVSAWRIEEERLLRVRVNGIRLYDFCKSDFGLKTGDLKGNKFRIIIRNLDSIGEPLTTLVRTVHEQITSKGIPNYFGYQRFGTIRPNTHLVGRELVKGNLEESVLQYLGRPFDTEPEDSREARRHLDETRDFQRSLELYPKHLTYERMMLAALAKNPSDYVGALRRLPRGLRTLLVHGYQAFLFNRMLSRMLELQEDVRDATLPLVGFKTNCLNEPNKSILAEEGVSPDNFRIRELPELSSEGDERPAFIAVNLASQAGEEGNNKSTVNVEFTLPPGSYATVVVREFMKSDPLNY